MESQGITEQLKAGQHRMEDAKALLAMNRWRGAMYLGGYAVECNLKAKLMKRHRCRTLADLDRRLLKLGRISRSQSAITHHLISLLNWTEAGTRLRQNRELWSLFSIVNRWIPAWRYSADRANREAASDFIDAVDRIVHWIDVNI